jgi:hypothetical protein
VNLVLILLQKVYKMKKLTTLAPLLVFAFYLFLYTGVTSCTKEKIIPKETIILDTVTITQTDTVIIQDTAISLDLLTANSWKLQELRGVNANTILFYERGGTSNTQNYDNDNLRFEASGTGVYLDENGYTHQIKWEFSNETNTKLTLVISNPAPDHSHTVIFENLRYKNKALYFDQYWTYNDVNSHAQCIRIPGD